MSVLFAVSYGARGLGVWIASRALVSAWLLTTCRGCDPVELLFGAPTALVAIVLAIALGLLETHRRREWALIGNLGVTRTMIAALFAVPAVGGEVGLRLARLLAG